VGTHIGTIDQKGAWAARGVLEWWWGVREGGGNLEGFDSRLVAMSRAAANCWDSFAAVEVEASLELDNQKHSMSSDRVTSDPAKTSTPVT